MRDTLRIGSGAGFSGDRLDPALLLAEQGELDYMILECMAERTIALAQLRRQQDPEAGYDLLLERRIEMLLPTLKHKGIRLLTNMGGANPLAAAGKIIEVARRLGIPVKVAALTGDDVLALLDQDQLTMESAQPLSNYAPLISANAYMGIEALLPALETDADIIITGRVADPSLVLAPLVHHFNWPLDDYDRLGKGMLVGHLLECAGQLCGGYFADPGKKDVPDFANLGFPYADIDRHGNTSFGKVAGSGGVINLMTVKEQVLYEVMDPANYLTPDVVADFSQVNVREIAPDRVAVSGATGRRRPDSLKVSVGYHAGYVGEGEISYAGQNCLARAKLAGEVVRERLRNAFSELRVDLIGSTALHGQAFMRDENPYEIRLRVAGRARDRQTAARIGEEVEALYTNGPAGGGGARKYVHEQVGIVSCLLPRERVMPQVTLFE